MSVFEGEETGMVRVLNRSFGVLVVVFGVAAPAAADPSLLADRPGETAEALPVEKDFPTSWKIDRSGAQMSGWTAYSDKDSDSEDTVTPADCNPGQVLSDAALGQSLAEVHATPHETSLTAGLVKVEVVRGSARGSTLDALAGFVQTVRRLHDLP